MLPVTLSRDIASATIVRCRTLVRHGLNSVVFLAIFLCLLFQIWFFFDRLELIRRFNPIIRVVVDE